MEMEMPKEESVWESRKRNYDSEEYVHEDDFVPGLEGFLHNIKRLDHPLTCWPNRMIFLVTVWRYTFQREDKAGEAIASF